MEKKLDFDETNLLVELILNMCLSLEIIEIKKKTSSKKIWGNEFFKFLPAM
jgi:hypothetical protein